MKNIKSLLEDIEKEKQLEEAKGDFPPEKGAPVEDAGDDVAPETDEDEENEDETVADHAPDGKGHYSADDLREIIDYVYDVLRKEDEESGDGGDDDDDEDNKKDGDIGLDIIYEYADLLPETVINQIVDDLKDIFEIEDTMLESIVTEGSAFFSKSQKGPAAKAARKAMRAFYRKNKSKILKRNKKWRAGEHGKKMIKLHRKAMSKGSWIGKVKGKRVVAQV